MADLTVVASKVWLASPHAPFRVTVPAHEAITAGQICYVNSDGEAQLSITNASGLSALFDGIAITSVAAGDPVTLFQLGSIIHFDDQAFTIGAFFYPSATEGGGAISDAQVSTGEMPVLKAVTATDLMVVRMNRPQVDNS
jgi:hypothetical protein